MARARFSRRKSARAASESISPAPVFQCTTRCRFRWASTIRRSPASTAPARRAQLNTSTLSRGTPWMPGSCARWRSARKSCSRSSRKSRTSQEAKPLMNMEQLREFVFLENRKRDLDAELKAANQRLDELEDLIIPQFIEAGVPSIAVTVDVAPRWPPGWVWSVDTPRGAVDIASFAATYISAPLISSPNVEILPPRNRGAHAAGASVWPDHLSGRAGHPLKPANRHPPGCIAGRTDVDDTASASPLPPPGKASPGASSALGSVPSSFPGSAEPTPEHSASSSSSTPRFRKLPVGNSLAFQKKCSDTPSLRWLTGDKFSMSATWGARRRRMLKNPCPPLPEQGREKRNPCR